MRITSWWAAVFLATSCAAHALNTQAPPPPRAGTGQSVEDSVVVKGQGTVTKVDLAHQTVFIDGTAYRYHEFGTHRRDPQQAVTTPTSDGPIPGTVVEFVAKRERSFDKPRIVQLRTADSPNHGK